MKWDGEPVAYRREDVAKAALILALALFGPALGDGLARMLGG